jgi:phosphatidylglycerol:prolipoprotein diacylglycerol transferase
MVRGDMAGSPLALAIPYFEQPSLGPFHLFGALVAAAVLVGTWILRKKSIQDHIDPEVSGQMVFWALVAGFIGAHLVDRFVYFPKETFEDPITILKVWQGISSFGGILGGVVGIILFIRKTKMGTIRWRYIDGIAYAFTFGWIFGRLGCFVAFDHPGTPTDFFLGQENASGVKIHNLGLYEALYFVPLAGLFHLLGRKLRFPGFFVGLLCVAYTPVRFFYDSLRIVDVRYLGLTPGQWSSIAMFGLGVWILAGGKRRAADELAAGGVDAVVAADPSSGHVAESQGRARPAVSKGKKK